MKQILNVGNINCAGCAANIMTALSMLDGIKDAAVDIEAHRVTVIYRPPLQEQEIMRQLELAGFEPQVIA